MSSTPVEAGKQMVHRVRRGGFPRFALTVRNASTETAYCEAVAIGRSR